MEIVVILVLLVGFLAYAFSGDKNQRDSGLPRVDFHPRQEGNTQRVRSFDAKSAIPQPTSTTIVGSAYVVDGDTLVIGKTQIRLFGVDAPELSHPHGKSAKWALFSMCKGQVVRAEVTQKDSHGRTVAQCYLQDGRDLSAEMVKIGFALDWPKFSGGKYRSLESPEARKKLWLADARQKGHLHVWDQFEAKQNATREKKGS